MPGKPKGLPKTGGRKKGTPNKVTASIRDAFKEAFEQLGGVPALVSWARSEPTEFYKLASKLIPQEITGKDGKDLGGFVGLQVIAPAEQPK